MLIAIESVTPGMRVTACEDARDGGRRLSGIVGRVSASPAGAVRLTFVGYPRTVELPVVVYRGTLIERHTSEAVRS